MTYLAIVCDADGRTLDVYEGPMRWVAQMARWSLRYYRREDADNLAGRTGPHDAVSVVFRRADLPLAPL